MGNIHEMSELTAGLLLRGVRALQAVPCTCGLMVTLLNLTAHRAEGEITHWTGTCTLCKTEHTILND